MKFLTLINYNYEKFYPFLYQSSDCNDHPATKREGSEIADAQTGVNHLQMRSEEHSEFFRSFCIELQKGVNYLQFKSKEHSEFFRSFCNL